jgi:thiol-disulfide isomerase/thioredoxin
MERKPEEQGSEQPLSDAEDPSNTPHDALPDGSSDQRPWWKRHGSDIAWVLAIVLLWQTGGLAWFQAQVLRLTAPAPHVETLAADQADSAGAENAADPANNSLDHAAQLLPASAWQWRLRRLDGPVDEQFLSLEDFRGRPLFVNRWATWCGPCRAELPSIERLHDAFGEDLAMLLISDENPDVLLSWLDKNGYAELPVYRAASAAPAPFAVRSIPASWLIDPSGRVVAEHKGAARWDAAPVRAAVQQMLP